MRGRGVCIDRQGMCFGGGGILCLCVFWGGSDRGAVYECWEEGLGGGQLCFLSLCAEECPLGFAVATPQLVQESLVISQPCNHCSKPLLLLLSVCLCPPRWPPSLVLRTCWRSCARTHTTQQRCVWRRDRWVGGEFEWTTPSHTGCCPQPTHVFPPPTHTQHTHTGRDHAAGDVRGAG